MKRLEQLPEITETALGGLTAGQNLKFRIEKAARGEQKPARSFRKPAVWVPALCCALVLVVTAVFAIPALMPKPHAPSSLISTRAAGVETSAPSVRALLDLNDTDVSVSQRASTPSYHSLWARGENGNFPLVGINGRYYRMMTSPGSVDSSLCGSSLGTVAEYTTEPSLSGTDVILSNVAAQGTEIYEVSGMGGTLVVASVDGANRLFQRVSYNGYATTGGESLADTLQISGHVLAMELSGVGTVTDASTLQSLVSTLTNNASYENSGSVSGEQSLLISLDNGLTVQMNVKNDKLGACGSWSCQDFIDAFANAAE